MITFYKDNEIRIDFTSKPICDFLDPCDPDISEEERKDRLKKPYQNRYSLGVRVTYNGKVFYFVIPKGYRWNGANVPRFAWSIIGSMDDPKFRTASCLHDRLCENHQFVAYDRKLSTKIFCSLLKVADVPNWKITLMYHAVDNFQKLCGWKDPDLKKRNNKNKKNNNKNKDEKIDK